MNKTMRVAMAMVIAPFFAFIAPTFPVGVAKRMANSGGDTAMQTPGYYTMQLGKFRITALYDGNLTLDVKSLFKKNLNETETTSLLNRMFIDNAEQVSTSDNAYFVQTDSNNVLIDAGCGSYFGANTGKVMENLSKAGINKNNIDVILITHFHTDHTGGLLDKDGKPAYPNAILRMSKEEADFWTDTSNVSKLSSMVKPMFALAVQIVNAYKNIGHFQTFKDGDSMYGIQFINTHGHTMGHTSYRIISGNNAMLILGDIVHNHAVQFPHPEAVAFYDLDGKTALASRKRIFFDAAKNRTLLAGAHLPFPGIGHIRTEGNGYVWVPVEYKPIGVR